MVPWNQVLISNSPALESQAVGLQPPCISGSQLEAEERCQGTEAETGGHSSSSSSSPICPLQISGRAGVIMHTRLRGWVESDVGGDALGLGLQVDEADADEEDYESSEQEPEIPFEQHPDQADTDEEQILWGATLSLILQQERIANASAHGGGSPVADDGAEDCGFFGHRPGKGKRMKTRAEANQTSPIWCYLRERLRLLEEEEFPSTDSGSSNSQANPAANIIHVSTLTPAEMTEVQLDGPGSAAAVPGGDTGGDTDAD